MADPEKECPAQKPEERGNELSKSNQDKSELFERMPVSRALMIMAVPTIISQLITLIYNIADTWFIGRTNNPYMVAACSLTATVFLMINSLSNLFGTGGGNLVVQLLGVKEEDEAKKVASLCLSLAFFSALAFSLICLFWMNPLLKILGASENTLEYARQYLLFVVVIGGVPTVLSNTMSTMLRNVGYSREAAFGLGMGGVLNILLDPLFMFVLLPDGMQVMGAGIATMLSNVISLIYYIIMYHRVHTRTVLSLPRRMEKVRTDSLRAIFSVGLPAAATLIFYDMCNITINMLSASHGDIELAAIGIVLKVERLPLNIGIGICLGMMPLVAYNFAAKNEQRMKAFFTTARTYGFIISLICLVLYRVFAADIMRAFIADEATVSLGTTFLQARCFAPPMMFLSFHMVHYMQSIRHGIVSFWLAFIRFICLNIPMLFLLNSLFGMNGIIWTQFSADAINVVISYIIYARVSKKQNALAD